MEERILTEIEQQCFDAVIEPKTKGLKIPQDGPFGPHAIPAIQLIFKDRFARTA
jgi:hypothetical protein